MRAKRKKRSRESKQNEGAQMSSELESHGAEAMVVIEPWWRFGVIGADGVCIMVFKLVTTVDCLPGGKGGTGENDQNTRSWWGYGGDRAMVAI